MFAGYVLNMVLFLIIELFTLAANTFLKSFLACCCSLSEMKAWQCGFALKNSRQWNFTSSFSSHLLSRCTGLPHIPDFCLQKNLYEERLTTPYQDGPELWPYRLKTRAESVWGKPDSLCALANSKYRQHSWQGCGHAWNPFLGLFKDPHNVLRSSSSDVVSPHKGQLMDVLEDGGMEICIMGCLFHSSDSCIISFSFPQGGERWPYLAPWPRLLG